MSTLTEPKPFRRVTALAYPQSAGNMPSDHSALKTALECVMGRVSEMRRECDFADVVKLPFTSIPRRSGR